MPTQTRHTPTPWHIGVKTAYCRRDIYGQNGEFVGITDDACADRSQAIADAAFIVRAVNSHAALVEALQACDKAFANWQLGQIPGRPDDILALINKARAALAQAEGR